MKVNKYKFFVLISVVILFNSLNSYYLAQTKKNSIIKLFCLESVKEEMLRAELKYNKEIANETCECYYEEFKQNSSHQQAKKKCKLKAQDSFES